MNVIARVIVSVSDLRVAVGKSAASWPRGWIESLEDEVTGSIFKK